MRLILHYTPSSPFCKFAMMTAIHKQLPIDLYISNPMLAENQRLASISPLKRIPVLEIYEDSNHLTVLNDSMLICQYLDGLTKNKVIKDGYAFLALCYNNRGIAERALSLLYEIRRPDELKSQEVMDRLRTTLDMSIDQVEQVLETYPINEVNLVAITLATLLGYLDFRFGMIFNWRDNRPKLTKWFANFQTQDVFQQTRSFEMTELEQGAIYSYDATCEIDHSLNPRAAFLARAHIIEPAVTASQNIKLNSWSSSV